MTDITKLPDKWLDDFGRGGIPFPLQDAIDELREALPTWTRITDEPDTWPEEKTPFVILGASNEFSIIRADVTHRTIRHEIGRKWQPFWMGAWWRPLCSIDYPPEDM